MQDGKDLNDYQAEILLFLKNKNKMWLIKSPATLRLKLKFIQCGEYAHQKSENNH